METLNVPNKTYETTPAEKFLVFNDDTAQRYTTYIKDATRSTQLYMAFTTLKTVPVLNRLLEKFFKDNNLFRLYVKKNFFEIFAKKNYMFLVFILRETILWWKQVKMFPNAYLLAEADTYAKWGEPDRIRIAFPNAKQLEKIEINRKEFLDFMSTVNETLKDEARDCASIIDGNWTFASTVFTIINNYLNDVRNDKLFNSCMCRHYLQAQNRNSIVFK